MDTKSLEVFLAVSDMLSFSRSGARLNMSVSAVSRTVARLEHEVGQSLFERDRRRVRLTSAGREFRAYALHALAQWHQLQRRLDVEGGTSGEVSLFCSVTASYSVLAPVLDQFRRAYPRVDIMLHTGDQADGISRILTAQDDVAVSLRPLNLPARLEFQSLLESPLKLYAPAAPCAVRDLVLEHDQPPDAINWDKVPFIVPERGITKDLFDAWLARRAINPRIYAQVAGHEAIVAMAGLGLGVGIAPAIVVEEGGLSAQVEEVSLTDPLPNLDIGLCCASQRLGSPAVAALWEVAGQTYG